MDVCWASQAEGGSDGERGVASAGASKVGLQGCGGQYPFSEKAAVAGHQLCPTSVCGYFPNLSAHYFSRTDVARNWLGVITIAAFVIHWWMLHSFQRSIETFRNRLVWVYRTYFSEEERAGLDLRLQPRSYWYQPEVYIGLLAFSFVGALLT